jgi:ribosome-associated translation inhibitor RaiA
MTTPQESSPQIVYMTDGPVPESVRQGADSMVGKLADISPRPVIFARVKVKVDEARNPDEQSIAQGTLDVSGSIIRAQAAAGNPQQAMGILENRLERRLARLAERREDANERPPYTPEGTWRRGDLPSKRPGYYDRPVEERRVIRKKTYAPEEEVSIDEAIFDLDVLDHRFFLFTDESDGKPSIVYEDGPGIALRKLDGSSPPTGGARASIDVNETPAPSVRVEEAIERLNVSDEPFVFFEDADTHLASVLYRRYDGHYGLIVPASG